MVVPVVFNVLKINIVLNFEITVRSNYIPKDMPVSCNNLVCDQDFETAMIIKSVSVCPGT